LSILEILSVYLHHRFPVRIIYVFYKTLLTIKNSFIMAYVIGDNCIACGTCIDECPVGAISEGEKYSINPDMCTECGTCASVCPNEAISLPE
jgi:ferredoxin